MRTASAEHALPNTLRNAHVSGMKPLGFVQSDAEWEGPVELLFTIDREHTKTVRYRSPVGRRMFDLCAPLFLLSNLSADEMPQLLVAAIGKSAEPLRTIG